MMKYLITATLLSATSFALPPNLEAPLEQQNYPENIAVNNRILLKINGKPITVMDVMRKMDLLFYKQFPELSSSAMARYQFYMSGWRTILGAVIDDQLIMADAEEKKVEVSDGEVREELERLFGPDVVLNLDKLGLTLDEAFDLLKTELVVQRMTGVMVRTKALSDVHPSELRKKYAEYLQKNPPQDQWVYQVLSIRGDHHKEAAAKAYRWLAEQKVPFQEIVSKLKDDDLEISLSEEFRSADQDLSLSYKAILETLSVGAYSAPMTKKDVSRIFCLHEFQNGRSSTFKEMEEKIKQGLLQEAMAHHNETYRTKLREHYGLTESYLNQVIPPELEPFALR